MQAAEHQTRRFRVGVDVGGTFTDFVLSDLSSGSLVHFKQPSTPSDPSRAVELGIQAVLDQQSVPVSDVGLVVHGTTLALNTIIQRRGAKLGAIVSRGSRDIFEIARCRMPSSYDFRATKEEPVVPRERVFEIGCRMLAGGTVEGSVDEQEIHAIADGLRRQGVEAVAIVLVNSYLDSGVERTVEAALRRHLPGVYVTCSAEIWPEIREYERALVAALNAYVHPLMDGYLRLLRSRLDGLGIDAPLYLTASNGGSLSMESTRARPIDTILSGPAAGVIAAASVARHAGCPDLVTFDMGGTSSDIAISRGGVPEYTTRTHVGGMPLMLPVVSVSAIGAGGGSTIWVDAQGVLKVGPQSAGSNPGPVSYGLGGKEPTVTDCYLTLGLIDPDAFLGGRMRLDRQKAVRALDVLAGRVGLTGESAPERVAEAALDVVTSGMAAETLKVLTQNGASAHELSLMAFGGAGPVHATMLAEEVGFSRVLIPLASGTFCALGALIADVKRDFVKSTRARIGAASAERALRSAFDHLDRAASSWVAGEGELLREHSFEWSADIRYAGQAFDLTVGIPPDLHDENMISAASESFHLEHERLYGFRDEEAGIEVTSVRVRAVGRVPPITLPRLEGPIARDAPSPSKTRPVWFRGRLVESAVHQRTDLRTGHGFAGPAIVEQVDGAVWVMPGWRLTVDDASNLALERKKDDA